MPTTWEGYNIYHYVLHDFQLGDKNIITKGMWGLGKTSVGKRDVFPQTKKLEIPFVISEITLPNIISYSKLAHEVLCNIVFGVEGRLGKVNVDHQFESITTVHHLFFKSFKKRF